MPPTPTVGLAPRAEAPASWASTTATWPSSRRAIRADSIPRVDDKTITKEICHANGIPVPETYAVIRRYGDMRRFLQLIGDRSEFVIKPSTGAAGRGIIVIARRNGQRFRNRQRPHRHLGRSPLPPLDDPLRPVLARRAGR